MGGLNTNNEFFVNLMFVLGAKSLLKSEMPHIKTQEQSVNQIKSRSIC
jgi:hypothetical protein